MSDESPTPSSVPTKHEAPAADDANATKSAADPDQSSQLAGTVIQTPDAVARAAAESAAPWYTVVEGYEFCGELGHGAMGVVYKARHIKLNRLVALKTTLGGRIGEKDLIRFLAEAESVAAVKHSNVVQVYDYGEIGGRPFMALEFCPGGSLAQRLQSGPPFSPSEAAALVGKIACGVAAAHEEGIVHRDLKPGNVLLTEEGEPKVADFGLAKRGVSDLTDTQAVMGTPSYMSPEQAGGKAKFVGPQADVWSLGVILYECLAGVKPFPGTTTDEVLVKVLTATPTAVRTLSSNVPRDLDLICRKCLEKNPTDRYAGAKELADDLDRFGRGEPISARPLSPLTRTLRWAQRNPVVAGLFAAVVIVTLGLIGSLFSQYRQAVDRADTERAAKESAEVAAQETARREEAERLRARAELMATRTAAEAAQANVLIELLNDLFRSSDPLSDFFGDALPGLPTVATNEGQAATLRPFLRNAAIRFRASLTDPAVALVRAKLLASIGNGMKNLGMFAEAKDVLTEALALRRTHLSETHPELWRSELDLGRLETESGDYLAGIDRFRRVLAIQTRAGAGPDAILNTRLYLGVTLSTASLAEADAVLREVVKEREQLNGKSHKDTLLAKLSLIAWLLEKHKWAEIVTLFGELREGISAVPEARVRAIFDAVLDCQAKLAMAHVARAPGSVLAGSLRGYVAGIRTDIGRLEKLLADDHLLLIIFRFELAKLLLHVGEGREADELFARVLADAKKTTGLAHPKMLVFLDVYAKRLAATKRAGEARVLFDEAEKANRERFGPENPWLTDLLLQRAAFEQKWGASDKALDCVNEAIGLVNRGKFLPTAGSVRDLFETARTLGASPSKPLKTAARELFVALRPLVARSHGESSAEMVIVLRAEGNLLYDTGDCAGASASFARAEELLSAVPKLEPIERAIVLYWNGRLAIEGGRFVDAERHFRAAREGAKKVHDYSAADREDDALFLARALVGQGRYREAVPLFEEARKLALERKADEKQLAFADLEVATAQLAAGDRAAYRKTCAALFQRYGRSSNLDTLSRLAWAGGVGEWPEGWNPAAFGTAFAAAFKPNTALPWEYRGLALVQLRAGRFDEVEVALAKAGPPAQPVDHLIRGLVAAAHNDRVTAALSLAQAERFIEFQKPTEKNPFAYAGRFWHTDLEVAILRAELRAALAPPVAPAPHEPKR
jgi:tetratricopeptide (TPR) repeat protein/tRNA A-37 threonylcarbamoyl transferase component Bud32